MRYTLRDRHDAIKCNASYLRKTRNMPRRNDIQKILLIGAGPIVIGQACEFDYSGIQACKVLRDEGYYVILVNSKV